MSVFDKVKSIFKKDDKASSPTAGGSSNGAPKIWSMPPEMQREFEKGVKYNMKIVIRGLRKTGKSSLLARLHGRRLAEQYTPSAEISAATIRFQPKDLPEDHGAKLDMWDVVDVGLKPKGDSSSSQLQIAADATTIDVYRGCNCVIFLVDVMSRESLEYVVRESKSVPPTTSILIALNFTDLPKPHLVSERDVDDVCRKIQRVSTPMIFLASQDNPPEKTVSAAATWMPISAATGFGIDLLRAYFEIPFTMLHVETLETQMKALYKKVEEHQAWLLSERAMLNFEEREKAKPKTIFVPPEEPSSSSAKAHERDLSTSPKSPQPKPSAHREPVKEAPRREAKVTPPPTSRDYDESKISNDFFGDVSDNETPPAESSDDDVELQPPPQRRNVVRPGTSPKQQPAPSPVVAPPAAQPPIPITRTFSPPPPQLVDTSKTSQQNPSQKPAQKEVALSSRTGPLPPPSFEFVVDDAKGVDDGFFGADDGSDSEPPPSRNPPAAPQVAPALTSKKVEDTFFDDDKEDEEEVVKVVLRGGNRSSSDDDVHNDQRTKPARSGALRGVTRAPPPPKTTAKPATAAAVVAVDIAALVAQMQSAITEPAEQEAPKEKKPKKDKSEKKPKRDKSSKKSHRADHSDDGGFDEIVE